MAFWSCVCGLLGVVVLVAQPVAKPGAAAPVKAVGGVEMTDAAGDIEPIVYRESVGDGPEKEVKYPGFDVLKLTVTSDGTTLNFAAMLKTPPASAAFDVLEFYVDADNSRATGITPPASSAALAGLEFYGTLEVCLEHDLFGTRCAGTDERPKGHSAIVSLEKYGKEWMFKDTLLDLPASGSVKEAKAVKIAGPLVQASVPYAAMGVKPGQTIRLVVREACAAKMAGFFPDIILTLK